MASDEQVFELACKILANREERFAWKTAKYLKRLLAKQGCVIKEKTLEELLIANSQVPGCKIRHSSFPAKKSLDLLWGHINLVGELSTLPNITLDEAHEYYNPCQVPEDAPWCFLSHSFRDLKVVMQLRNQLLARGYGVWIFESEISEQAVITDAVQEGLNRANIFIAYLSRKALASRWVLKEMLVAFQKPDLKPNVLVDGKDAKLVELFMKWLENGWRDLNLSTEVNGLLSQMEQPDESVAITDIPDLLRAMISCPENRRRLVIYSDRPESELPDPESHPNLLSFEAAFPRV